MEEPRRLSLDAVLPYPGRGDRACGETRRDVKHASPIAPVKTTSAGGAGRVRRLPRVVAGEPGRRHRRVDHGTRTEAV
jgi:hypothetical protein